MHYCSIIKKLFKPGKKWTKGKNGLYSWKYTKTWYFKCLVTKKTEAEDGHPPNHAPTFLMIRDSGVNRASDDKLKCSVGKNDRKPNQIKSRPRQVAAINPSKCTQQTGSHV